MSEIDRCVACRGDAVGENVFEAHLSKSEPMSRVKKDAGIGSFQEARAISVSK